jgi:hypothetical protein
LRKQWPCISDSSLASVVSRKNRLQERVLLCVCRGVSSGLLTAVSWASLDAPPPARPARLAADAVPPGRPVTWGRGAGGVEPRGAVAWYAPCVCEPFRTIKNSLVVGRLLCCHRGARTRRSWFSSSLKPLART